MILLDTHAWIWWVTESMHLSKQAAQAIAQADRLGVHIISCWEVAMLVLRAANISDYTQHGHNLDFLGRCPRLY
jgi:PIN domain nuclease of toxin-antitoxin system